MGYYVYLKNLLSPMGVYDLEEGGGAGEIYALGDALDKIMGEIALTERECVVPTAQSLGLEAYESIFPILDASGTLTERRQSIMSLMQTDGTSFTPAGIAETLTACGAGMSVRDSETAHTAEVRMPTAVRGIIQPDESWLRRVESVLPCQLGYVLRYNFPTWDQISALCPTWNDIGEVTVSELECYYPDGE